MNKKLLRTRNDKYICGVCGGLAKYLGVDSTILRLIVTAITIFVQPLIILYIVACFIVPYEDDMNNGVKQEDILD